MKKHLSILALTAGISLVAALSTRASLLVYEGFDYGTSWLGATNSGGTGWGAGWMTGSQVYATNSATSLSYGSLQTSGGACLFGNPYGPVTGTQQAQRSLNSNLGLTNFFSGSGGTVWMSFLYQNWTTDNVGRLGFRQANVGLFSGGTTNAASGLSNAAGTERADVGALNTYTAGVVDNMSLWGSVVPQGMAQQSTFSTLRGSSTAPVLVLLRLDFDNTTAADTIYAWFNPTIGGVDPSTSTAISTNNIDASGINAIRFAVGNANASGTNAVMMVDEVRLGTTFADVTPVPEPMTFALAGLGGLMLLALRRRK
jgi:hypothetical protein